MIEQDIPVYIPPKDHMNMTPAEVERENQWEEIFYKWLYQQGRYGSNSS